MKPKEKAIQLINEYLSLLYGKKQFYKKSDCFKAKKCALICVDEIVNIGSNPRNPTGLKYWNDVIIEINSYNAFGCPNCGGGQYRTTKNYKPAKKCFECRFVQEIK